VFVFEVALQAQPPVAAVPQSQLPRRRGQFRLVAGLWTVRVETPEDPLADLVQ
jgi:hypothetical protein